MHNTVSCPGDTEASLVTINLSWCSHMAYLLHQLSILDPNVPSGEDSQSVNRLVCTIDNTCMIGIKARNLHM